MNFSDLFVVIALGSGLYAIAVALTGQRVFLLKAVNPHRLTWLLAGVSVLWVGLSLMRWEAGTWQPGAWVELLGRLVTDAPTPPRVKVATLAICFSLLMAALVFWCVFFYPRDPSTFTRPDQRKMAFRYYVTRLRGGLDFALLAHGDGQCLEEALNAAQVAAWCPHLPKIKPDGQAPRERTADDQLHAWRRLAARIHERMAELDALVGPAHQGRNRRLIFDIEFGGLFFHYLRHPDPAGGADTGLYLFGATLNQTEMAGGRAAEHFQLLLDAMYNIDRSIHAV